MCKIDSSVRVWLALLLTIALPLGSRAVEIRSTCHMACARGQKSCHSCCGEKPGCHLVSSVALPVAPGDLGQTSQQQDLLLLASPVWLPPLATLSNRSPAFELVREFGPPPKNVLANDCILLL